MAAAKFWTDYSMTSNKIHILSTSLLESSLEQKARQAGISLDAMPFIAVQSRLSESLQQQLPLLAAQKKTVVFTSAKAVLAIKEYLPPSIAAWTIFCMDSSTRQTVDEVFGAEAVAGTANSARQLAALVAASRPEEEIIFFCGNIRRQELTDQLHALKLLVTEKQVYETTLKPLSIHRVYDGILFFSPSAVRSFFAVNQVPQSTSLFAIGETTAREIRQFSTNNLICSPIPAKALLLDAAIDFFKSANNNPPLKKK